MKLTYNVVPEHALPNLYAILKAERTLWAIWPEHGESCTEEEFCAAMSVHDVLVLAGNIDGDPAGVLTLRPFCSDRTLCGEVGLMALRKYFPVAAPLCRSALIWCYDNLELRSMVGRVACQHHHILSMLGQVGFSRAALIPGLCWHERKQQFVDGWLVTATRQTVERSMAS